ncbi:MAG TPA: hypothetical protein PKA00_06615 [Saprospiraceae bacterium]|nr:hypothetical protein [Saprospiraceae bacterium]HMQ82559.1 hypothetical protein [Saprospiraceae bacterium]
MALFQLDDSAYNQMLNLLNNQHFVERGGKQEDMLFLSEDWWLRDTAVIEIIFKREGMWEINLVFAHYRRPFQLIVRAISRYSSKDKAQLNAQYMRRLAAKDQRGTLKLDINDFNLCFS